MLTHVRSNPPHVPGAPRTSRPHGRPHPRRTPTPNLTTTTTTTTAHRLLHPTALYYYPLLPAAVRRKPVIIFPFFQPPFLHKLFNMCNVSSPHFVIFTLHSEFWGVFGEGLSALVFFYFFHHVTPDVGDDS